MHSLARPALVALSTSLASQPAPAQPDLAAYFGFEPQRIIVIGDGAGPATSADFNADGLPDLAVVNNAASRIELLLLRSSPRTTEERTRSMRVNELPPNAWYDRVELGVPHRVTALVPHDVDDDGRIDIVYAGTDPASLVVLRQERPSVFEEWHRLRVPSLTARPAGLIVADVIGDERPEVLTLVDGRATSFALGPDGRLGDPTPIGSDGSVVALFAEDFNADGRTDLLGVAPDHATPLRLWLRASDGSLSGELRFEMPPLAEVEPVRFPHRPAASIAVIERATRRMVFYDLVTGEGPALLTQPRAGGARDLPARILAFPEGPRDDRSVEIGDVNNDGLADVIATDRQSNSLSIMLQEKGRGLTSPRSHPTFKAPKVVGIGRWHDEPAVFVLSEEERVLGFSRYDPDTRRLGFPTPISIATAGATPVMMRPVTIDGREALAVVVKQRRDYLLELHFPDRPDSEPPLTFELEDARREPRMILAADADRDGHSDLLILTPGEPMAMLRSAGGGAELLGKDEMPQFGLVQAAGPANTAVTDLDGDGMDEILIADANFVRACAYHPERGWQVLQQTNAPDPQARFEGLGVIESGDGTLIVAADAARDRLFFLGKRDRDEWSIRDVVRVLGVDVSTIVAGSFTGDDSPSVLAIASEGLAIVRLAGTRPVLDAFASRSAENDDRVEHEIEVGDLNADGYTDVVVLDAGEQMCSIYTFSSARRLHPAMEFEVFESRLFTGGQTRQYEPSAAIVADLTGDGRDDLALLVHDRVLVYPQPAPRAPARAPGRE